MKLVVSRKAMGEGGYPWTKTKLRNRNYTEYLSPGHAKLIWTKYFRLSRSLIKIFRSYCKVLFTFQIFKPLKICLHFRPGFSLRGRCGNGRERGRNYSRGQSARGRERASSPFLCRLSWLLPRNIFLSEYPQVLLMPSLKVLKEAFNGCYCNKNEESVLHDI